MQACTTTNARTGRFQAAPRTTRSCLRWARCSVASAAEAETSTSAPVEQQLVTVTLRKPVGVVFSQKPNGPVFVEELVPGGAAERCGRIAVGDVLSQCSATLLKAGKDTGVGRGHGDRPYDNFEKVMFDCEGQDFKTVMSALKSNNERWGIFDVTLVFRRPAHMVPTSEATASAGADAASTAAAS